MHCLLNHIRLYPDFISFQKMCNMLSFSVISKMLQKLSSLCVAAQLWESWDDPKCTSFYPSTVIFNLIFYNVRSKIEFWKFSCHLVTWPRSWKQNKNKFEKKKTFWKQFFCFRFKSCIQEYDDDNRPTYQNSIANSRVFGFRQNLEILFLN